MGVAYFIVLDKEVDFDTFVNGGFLGSSAEALLSFCTKHSLKSIDDFYSQDAGEMLEELGGFDMDDFDIPEGGNQWFSADEGIDWIDRTISKLQTEEFGSPVEPIISDLHEYRAVLLKAKSADAKWHLELDI